MYIMRERFHCTHVYYERKVPLYTCTCILCTVSSFHDVVVVVVVVYHSSFYIVVVVSSSDDNMMDVVMDVEETDEVSYEVVVVGERGEGDV